MNETTFEDARVGDRVWDFGSGWGQIDSIPLFPEEYMRVNFHNANISRYMAYNLNGVNIYAQNQTLFWDEIKFEAPPRPKRMVKKVVVGWVNIYSGRCGSIYDTPAEARRNRDADCLGDPLLIKHEYEVEE